jgi:hypothetical protein
MHEHGFGTIQSNSLHTQTNFAFGGLPRRHIFDLQHFRPTDFVKANYFGHVVLPTHKISPSCDESEPLARPSLYRSH